MKVWATAPGSRRQFARSGASASARAARRNRASTRWSALRSCRRAGRSPAACERARTRRRARPRRPRRARSLPVALRRPARKALGVAALPRGAWPAPRAERRRPASWACRWWRRDPSWLARSRRCARPASAPPPAGGSRGFACRRSSSTAIEPRDHPLDIAVDRRRAPAEGDRRDRGGRIGADARASARSSSSVGGKQPPWRATTARAQACRLRARA